MALITLVYLRCFVFMVRGGKEGLPSLRGSYLGEGGLIGRVTYIFLPLVYNLSQYIGNCIEKSALDCDC